MDKEKAEDLARKLVGKQLDGWTIERLRNHGKSAAVFFARKAGTTAAVKVFDSEIIERYGDNAQKSRIARELELRGQMHPNLVAIYGGGFDEELNLYFVIMEFLDGPNLKEALHTIRPDQIGDLIEQLASAAKFLEDRGLVHRDIKPENIVLLDGGRRLVLLDFGVIRPIKGSDLTDPEGIQAFIGTLQYSSPEFLLREENQDVEGYRALTFYQIGAVLHDLIVKRPIFEKFANPYAKLVNAVQVEVPAIANPEVPQSLISLAQRCLLKKASLRTRLIRWEHFSVTNRTPAATARERVAEKLETLRAQAEDVTGAVQTTNRSAKVMRDNILASIKIAGRTARASMPGLPPLESRLCPSDKSCLEFVFAVAPDLGFPHKLAIVVAIDVIDPFENVVSCAGFAYFPSDERPIAEPSKFLTPWFEGIFDDVALHSSFGQFFFRATEWCLQVSPGIQGHEIFQPTPSDAAIDGPDLVENSRTAG